MSCWNTTGSRGWKKGSWQLELPVMCVNHGSEVSRDPPAHWHTISQLTTETNQAWWWHNSSPQRDQLKSGIPSVFNCARGVRLVACCCCCCALNSVTLCSNATAPDKTWPIESRNSPALINSYLVPCIITYANLLCSTLKRTKRL